MSINRSKYFLFLLFFLINKFIFISGGMQDLTKTNSTDLSEVKNGDIFLENNGANANQITSNNEDQKKRKYDSCEDVQPTNGIISDCTTHSIDNSRSCCYVTINYEYNEFNLCVQTQKDLDIIKNKIDKLKQEYEGCDSVDIDCHSAFINFSFMFLLVVLVF